MIDIEKGNFRNPCLFAAKHQRNLFILISRQQKISEKCQREKVEKTERIESRLPNECFLR